MKRFIDCPTRLATKDFICVICGKIIIRGEFYHDRGRKIRCHTDCAKKCAELER